MLQRSIGLVTHVLQNIILYLIDKKNFTHTHTFDCNIMLIFYMFIFYHALILHVTKFIFWNQRKVYLVQIFLCLNTFYQWIVLQWDFEGKKKQSQQSSSSQMKDFSEQKLVVCAQKWTRIIHSFKRFIPKHRNTFNTQPTCSSELSQTHAAHEMRQINSFSVVGSVNSMIERLASLSSATWLYSCRSIWMCTNEERKLKCFGESKEWQTTS